MTYLRMMAAAVALGVVVLAMRGLAATPESAPGTAAPDITGGGRWFNSPPLTLGALRGKVVLVEFWTRECINCIDVLPHIRDWHDRYTKNGLVIIGVHTPEYDEERDPLALQADLRREHITWPVAMDNDYRIWSAYGNSYWPAIYLIDRQGRLVYQHVGEGHYEQTEQHLRQLLGET